MKKNVVYPSGGIVISFLKKNLLKMKLTFLCLLLGIAQLLASKGFSQSTVRLTLNLEDVRVEEVLLQIEEQSNLYFIYNREVVDVNRKVNVSYNNMELPQVLSNLFTGTGVEYEIRENHVILKSSSGQAVQQSIKVSGKVTDSSGSPLPGVTVVLKGTTQGTITGGDGNFSLTNVSRDAILVFSFVGMRTQEINIAGRTSIDVVLEEETIGIEEVVAIGYGELSKRSVTTSMSKVDGTQFQEMPVGTVAEGLYGLMSGIRIQQNDGQPGAAPSIRIRGAGSITNSNEPLYVIDGFPTNDNTYFTNLSANDIESISIAKDAASAAIYGSRAGNGVIIVTTKKGSKNEKPKINFDATIGVSQPQRYIDVLNASEFVEMVKEARDAYGMPYLAILDDPSQWKETNWQKVIFRDDALMQRYNLSIDGGSDKIRFNVSANFQDQEGIIVNSFDQRIGLAAKIEADLNRFITVGVNLSPTYSKKRVQDPSGGNTSVTKGGIADAITYPPIYAPYQENGDYFQIAQHASNSGFNTELSNPLSKLLEIDNDYTTFLTRNQAYVKIKPVAGLVINSNFNFGTNSAKNEYYRSAYSPGSSRQGNKSTPNLAAIDAYRSSLFGYNWYWSTTANYSHTFNEAHMITALVGYDVSYFSDYSVQQDDRTDSDYPVAYDNTSITNVNGALLYDGSSTNTEYTFDAFFSRLIYDYKGKYLASASIRRDRSSKFGPDNRSGLFWSTSLAWNLSEEPWMKEALDWLTVAKIRGSYGVTGNDQTGENYVWMATMAKDDYYVYGQGTEVDRVTGYYPDGYSNPRLGWEKNTQYDIGIELGLFKRFSFTMDWYRRKSDAVLSASIPNLNGKSSTVMMNAGEVENKGVEIEVGAPIINREFKWKADFNISFNRNKLLSLATGQDYYGSVSGSIRNYVGRPLGDIYLYTCIGTFNTQEDVDTHARYYTQSIGDIMYKDVDNSGSITSNDMEYAGNYQPKFNAGFSSEFSYKNLDLSFVLDGQYGGVIYWGYGYAGALNRYMENSIAYYGLNRWRSAEDPGNGYSQKAGTFNILGAINQSDRFLFSSDFLRIRNISLGYRVPGTFARKIGIQSLKVNLSVQNLYTFCDYPGYSVESTSSTSPTESGSDTGQYPSSRTMTLGIKIGF